jgi:hypothetical protein
VDATSLFAPEGRAGRLRQNAKIQNRKNQNFKNCKSQKLKFRKLSSQFFFHKIDRENLSRKIVFLFFKINDKTSALCLLALHSQCVRFIFNASKQCPHEATTFYLAEQPR